MNQYFEDFLKRGWKPNFDVHPSDANLEMVIVEPRNHEHLAGVLSNMSALVPNAMLTVIHSKENSDLVHSIVKPNSSENNVRLIPCFQSNIDRDTYSKLLMSPEFWGIMRAPKTLIFQTDTALRHNSLLRFMHYDYIGAPWTGPVCNDPNVRIGNGGFSLRSRSFMEDIAMKTVFNQDTSQPPLPEDVHFGKHIVTYNDAVIPSIADASMFGLEYMQHPNPMAVHKAWTFDVHSEEYIRDIMTTNLASPSQTSSIVIMDAWVESENGYICKTYNISSWLSIGITTDGLRVPKGSVLSCLEKDPFPGRKKYMKVKVIANGVGRLYTVRLHHNQLIEDLVIS